MARYSCPRCKEPLVEVEASNVLVDVCKNGCGGIWFDEKEIKKFDEANENIAPLVFSPIKPAPEPSRRDQGPALACPKCSGDSVLARRASGPDGKITIDQCLTCLGIWFDAGELATYREQYKTEAERQKAADEFLRPHLDVMLEEVQHEIDHTKALTEEYRQANSRGKKLVLFLRDFFGR